MVRERVSPCRTICEEGYVVNENLKAPKVESMYVAPNIKPPDSGLPLFRVLGPLGVDGEDRALDEIGDRPGDLSFDLNNASLGREWLAVLNRLANRARVGGGKLYLLVPDPKIRKRLENTYLDADIVLMA